MIYVLTTQIGQQPAGELLQGGDDQEWHPAGPQREQDLHEAEGPHLGEEIAGGQG